MGEVTWESAAAEQFDALPRPIKARVLRLVERLQNWPEVSGARLLAGELAGHWRMRTGDYRLQFRVEGREVIIERVGHRDGFYDGAGS